MLECVLNVSEGRDQAHLAAGLLPLRFTDAQVAYDKPYVKTTLRHTAEWLRDGGDGRPDR